MTCKRCGHNGEDHGRASVVSFRCDACQQPGCACCGFLPLRAAYAGGLVSVEPPGIERDADGLPVRMLLG